MRTILSIAVIVASMAPAAAQQMICTNPGRDYLVTVVGDDLVLNPDSDAARYPILGRFDETVFGTVPMEEGMAFAADFGSNPAVRYFADAELVQTDECRLK